MAQFRSLLNRKLAFAQGLWDVSKNLKASRAHLFALRQLDAFWDLFRFFHRCIHWFWWTQWVKRCFIDTRKQVSVGECCRSCGCSSQCFLLFACLLTRFIVQELAPVAIWAIKLFVEPLALLCLVIARHISALLQLMTAVREWACIRVLTCAVQLPEFADLCLKLHLKARLSSICGISST